MSLWHCSTHGLYGGDVFCPSCGDTGTLATVDEREKLFAFGPIRVLVTPKRVDIEDSAVGCIVLDHRTAREIAKVLLIALGEPA